LEHTLFIVKPDAVRRDLVGRILGRVEGGGLKLVALRMTRLSKARACDFYHVHKGKDFYDRLTTYMSSGRCVVAVAEGEDAINRLRTICGITDPSKAAEGTIRLDFGLDITMNSVHASDSPASAEEEIRFFFPDLG
jgi:nucleoside-diphosphate kinase